MRMQVVILTNEVRPYEFRNIFIQLSTLPLLLHLNGSSRSNPV